MVLLLWIFFGIPNQACRVLEQRLVLVPVMVELLTSVQDDHASKAPLECPLGLIPEVKRGWVNTEQAASYDQTGIESDALKKN